MREDFIKSEHFKALSHNKDNITIRDLVEFVRTFANVNLKSEELEAILRRIDHSADQMINYEEFCELVSVNDNNIKSSEDLHEILNRTASKELRHDI